MATQPGRTVLRPVDPPRPLKSTLKQSHSVSSTYEVHSIEELITLMETVAVALVNGMCDNESVCALLAHLRSLGMQLELIAKDTLDKAFVSFRNASQDERLSIMTRLNLLELIELRAKGWQVSEDINSYYKHKASYVEPDATQNELISTSPQGMHASGISVTTPTNLNPFLAPGEIIRNSGKFSKPTKIPGKNYSKDEVVIRNADSGKVMGIKGRRVHMIEELSETIISFQRVNPGAKERLVQITGPNDDKINYAKQLIEDTIRRNASPVRLEAHEEDGCSSMASSTSDETPRHRMMQQQHQQHQQMQQHLHSIGQPKYHRNPQQLLHSYSTSDASLGEYKFTVSVGGSSIKITGDNLEFVRAAKLVLEDHFSSTEFVVDSGCYSEPVSFDGYSLNPNAPPMVPVTHQLVTTGSPMVDSGIALDKMATTTTTTTGRGRYMKQKSEADGDDDVFIVEENGSLVPVNALKHSGSNNGLSRSKKTNNFARKSMSPENALDRASLKQEINHENKIKMTYQIVELIEMAKAKSAMALPHDWVKICEKWPSLVRNKELGTIVEVKETIIEEKQKEAAKNIAAEVTPAPLNNGITSDLLNRSSSDSSSSGITMISPAPKTPVTPSEPNVASTAETN